MHPPPRLLSPSLGGLEERWGRPPQEWVDRETKMDGTDVGGEGKGRRAQELGKGDWSKVGAVSLTAPIKVMTQRHRIPVSTPSPPPLPPPCKHGFAKRCPELCGTPTMAGMGSGTPKEISVPLPCPPHPSQNLTPPHKTWDCSLGALAFPQLSYPNPIPTALPGLRGLDLWPFPPTSGDPDLWALASGPCRDPGSQHPHPCPSV